MQAHLVFGRIVGRGRGGGSKLAAHQNGILTIYSSAEI